MRNLIVYFATLIRTKGLCNISMYWRFRCFYHWSIGYLSFDSVLHKQCTTVNYLNAFPIVASHGWQMRSHAPNMHMADCRWRQSQLTSDQTWICVGVSADFDYQLRRRPLHHEQTWHDVRFTKNWVDRAVVVCVNCLAHSCCLYSSLQPHA